MSDESVRGSEPFRAPTDPFGYLTKPLVESSIYHTALREFVQRGVETEPVSVS